MQMLPDTTVFAGAELICPPRTSEKATKEFDLVPLPPRRRLVVGQAKNNEIRPLLRTAEVAIGSALAPESVVARVALAHPDSLWTFRKADQIVGGAALLTLNALGLHALLAGELDLGDPPTSFLARPADAPAAIYVWAILGPLIAVEGIAYVIRRLQSDPYRFADIYAIPQTRDGMRFTLGLGFHRVPNHPQDLFRYVRLANRADRN
jgi:hypothetical protein